MAVTSIYTIIDDINAIFQTVPGIKRVYTDAPDQAPTASGDLPCVIPLVDRLDVVPAAFDLPGLTYTIKYLLLVTPTNRGLISVSQSCLPYLDSVPSVFYAHVKLNDAAVDHGDLLYMEYKGIEYTPGSGIVHAGFEVGFSVTLRPLIPTVI